MTIDPSKIPDGFLFAGLSAGIKAKKKDLGLVYSEREAVAAGVFTQSKTRAASVNRSVSLLPTRKARAIVVASGNANAMTGPAGESHDEQMAAAVAGALDVEASSVLTATTGVIGVPFPIDRVIRNAAALVSGLGRDAAAAAAAMLTTDTTIKWSAREIYLGGVRVRILGLAKGSGMVHPNMATVLGFIVTDAAVAPKVLRSMLSGAAEETFGGLSVDGATSTNDSVLVMANGASGMQELANASSAQAKAFASALVQVCRDLAIAIARDGEGARKFITVDVSGTSTDKSARELGRSVVSSTLVKAAMFGADPSVGRVLAALGARAALADLPWDIAKVGVVLQGVTVFDRGAPVPFDGDALRSRLRQRDVTIEVRVGSGKGRAEAWGCDLSYDYVRINADYAAVLVDPEGPVRVDQRLDTKTPELKTEILVSALRYIERFAGTRAVIRYGQGTLARRERALSLAEDVRLLSASGLSPILVQEGSSEFLVTALAQAGVRAVGLSGADGHLLAWPSSDDPSRVVVDPDVVETLLGKGYVPVIVPEFTEEAALVVGPGQLDVDRVAAEIAVACGAKKLLLLGDSSGLLIDGCLVSELSAEDLRERIDAGLISKEMLPRALAASLALSRNVDSVHFLDERIAHVVVAELFTDTGVGTMAK